jgi:hypothetical protein
MICRIKLSRQLNIRNKNKIEPVKQSCLIDTVHYAWLALVGGLAIGSIVYTYESADNIVIASRGTNPGVLSGSSFSFTGADLVLVYQSGSCVKPVLPTFFKQKVYPDASSTSTWIMNNQ